MPKIINYKAVLDWVEEHCMVPNPDVVDPAFHHKEPMIPGTGPWYDFLRARMPGAIVERATGPFTPEGGHLLKPHYEILGEPDFPDLKQEIPYEDLEDGRTWYRNFASDLDCIAVQNYSVHIQDWYASLPEREKAKLPRMTWADAHRKADAWHQSMARKAEKKARKLVHLDGEDAEHAIDLGDGWRWVRLVTKEALEAESGYMGHCVGRGGYDEYLPRNAGHVVDDVDRNRMGNPFPARDRYPEGIWSLRNGAKSFVTVELAFDGTRRMADWQGRLPALQPYTSDAAIKPEPVKVIRPALFRQVQGRFNRPPEDGLRIHVARLAQAFHVPVQNGKWSVRDTSGHHHDLADLKGYIKVEGNLMLHARMLRTVAVPPAEGRRFHGHEPIVRILVHPKAGAVPSRSTPVVTVHGLSHRMDLPEGFLQGWFRLEPNGMDTPYRVADEGTEPRGRRGYAVLDEIQRDLAAAPDGRAREIMRRAAQGNARVNDAVDAMAYAMQAPAIVEAYGDALRDAMIHGVGMVELDMDEGEV